MTVKERLILFLKHKNLKPAQFEQAIGASNGYINSMRKGLGVDKIEHVRSVFPDLNIEWLITGEGEMLKIDEQNHPASVCKEDVAVSREAWEMIKLQTEAIISQQKAILIQQQTIDKQTETISKQADSISTLIPQKRNVPDAHGVDKKVAGDGK